MCAAATRAALAVLATHPRRADVAGAESVRSGPASTRPSGSGPADAELAGAVQNAVVSELLHVVVGILPEGASQDARLAAALEFGGALTGAPGVRTALLGCSAEHLVAACWLDSRDALEPFAESEPHMAFVMRGLAPLVRGMWSASVAIDAPPIDLTAIAALWVLAVPEHAGVYEWEVRRLLDSVAALPGHAATGPTVEERERFRAGGIVALRAEEIAPFEEALAAARAGWPAFAAELEEALVPVHPAAAAEPTHEGRCP